MSRWRDQSAASAVEFALVLPVLIILLFGTISVGMLYNQQLTMTQAAREGARFGATLSTSEANWSDQVRERTVATGSGVLGDCDITVTEPDADDVLSVRVECDGRLDIVMAPVWEPRLSAESVARHEGGGEA